MKNYIYYVSVFSNGRKAIQRDVYGEDHQFKTEQDVREYISSFESFCGWATKEEWEVFCFNNAMERMKPAFESDNLDYIFSCLSVNDNNFSRKCFEILSGVKLSRQWKYRKLELINYYGEKYAAYENKVKQEKERKEKEEQERIEKEKENMIKNAKERFINGEDIDGSEFVLLCDAYNIKLAIKSRGYCLNKLIYVNLSGSYRSKDGKSQGLFNAFFELKDILTNKD